MLRGVANQVVDGLDRLGKVFMVADLAATIGQPQRLAFVLIDIDEVNIAGNIELPRSQLAHANDPQRHFLAFRAGRSAVTGVQLLAHLGTGAIQRKLCQFRHATRDRVQIGLLGTIERHQALHDQLTHHPQRGRQIPALLLLQSLQRLLHGGTHRSAGRQNVHDIGITTMEALPETRMRCGKRSRGRWKMVCDLHAWHFGVQVHRFSAPLHLVSCTAKSRQGIIPSPVNL